MTDEWKGLRRGTFLRRKVPKSRQRDTGAEGPFQGQTRPFPPGTPFRDASCGGAIHRPPDLKAAACRFGAPCVVSASPEQSYLPRLENFCNSLAISMPLQVSAFCLSQAFHGGRRNMFAVIKKHGKKPACGQAGFLPGKKERRNAARLTELAQGSARAWEESRERGMFSVDRYMIPS